MAASLCVRTLWGKLGCMILCVSCFVWGIFEAQNLRDTVLQYSSAHFSHASSIHFIVIFIANVCQET